MSIGGLQGRTAIVTPIYNEDTERVFAGVEAIWRSLMQQRDQGCFDFFVLSDTRSPDIARAEEVAWRALVARLRAAGGSSIVDARTTSGARPAISPSSCATGAAPTTT